MRETQTMLSRALHYAEEGWSVFPVGADKAPLIKDNLNAASRDAAQISAWWAEHPEAAIGAVTDGPFWVVDIDSYQGGEYGKEEIEDIHGPLPHTRVHRTPSGGEHWFFRAPAGKMPRRMIGYFTGVDILGIGGFVILEGQVRNKQTKSLSSYEVHEDLPISDLEPKSLGIHSGNVTPNGAVYRLPEVHNPKGYGAKALARSCDVMRDAPEGGRNHLLNKIAFKLFCYARAGWVEYLQVAEDLGAAALAAGLERGEIAKTLESAHESSKTRSLEGEVVGDRSVMLPSKEPMRIAEAFAAEQNVVKYGGRFWCWDKDHHRRFDSGELQEVLWRFHDRVSCLDEKGAYIKYGAKINRVREVFEALSVVTPQAEPQKGVVACESGFVDLLTGELKPASPELFVPVFVPCRWTGEIDISGDWAHLVTSSLEFDPDRICLLAQWMGYILSGSNRLQKFFYLYGKTSSGKSVVMNVLRALVGDANAASITPEDFGSDKTNLFEPLIGKMLITGDDSRSGSGWGRPRVVSRILSITAGDAFPIDQKYRLPYDKPLIGRMVFMGNEAPKFNDNSGAIRRRCLILPFRKSFADEPDTMLGTRIIRDDMSSVLSFAQLGYAMLFKQKGIFTDVGEDELNAFSETQISAFAEGELEIGGDKTAEYGLTYERYKRWCDTNGETPLTNRKFCSELRNRLNLGKPYKSNGRSYHKGFGLL